MQPCTVSTEITALFILACKQKKMETRGSRNKILIEILKGAGLYEDGMEVEEMRQVAQAIEMSTEPFDSAESSNIERALLVIKQ